MYLEIKAKHLIIRNREYFLHYTVKLKLASLLDSYNLYYEASFSDISDIVWGIWESSSFSFFEENRSQPAKRSKCHLIRMVSNIW